MSDTTQTPITEIGEADKTTAIPVTQTEAKKTIDKEVFDKTASELAKVKKELQARMTAEELSQAEAQAKQQELENLKAEIKKQKLIANQNLAMGLTAEVKSFAGIEEADTEYLEFVKSLSNHDEKITTKLATQFAQIAKKAYEKGAQDTARGTIKTLANNVSVGSNGSSGVSDGKRIAEKMNGKNLGTTDLFTKINK